ncbi:hypothetical protein ABW19_dt0208253 [Dactylella cylindrospora]|nr:hypothetical protein ABW19_dt0208253 [Dactylella cylindrospora]
MPDDSDTRWQAQRQALTRYVQQKLLVRHLQTILKKLALPVSGLKVAQQSRLIDQIDKVVAARNDDGLQHLKRIIYNPDESHSSPSPSANVAPPPKPITLPGSYGSSNGIYVSPNPSPSQGTSSTGLNFYPSPFYTIKSNLTPIHGLQAFGANAAQHRHVVSIPLTISQQTFDDIHRSGFRTILYCACIEGSVIGPHHVAFPQQIEIRVNSKTVAANLRGLKNRPGTTRPLDITDYLEKAPMPKNNIMITYALSQKRYLANVKLVRKITPEELVAQIKKRPHISKQNVLERLRKESEDDDDIVATSTVMSLKCPASMMRISTPIRSTSCKHHQCYDAISFLQLQEQAPTWQCPVCYKKIEFEHLAVDKYVEEILNSVPKSVDSVTIDPMGNWSIPKPKSPSPRIKNDYSDDSEDELLILHNAPPAFKTNNSFTHSTPVSTNNHSTSFARPSLAATPKSLSSEPPATSARPNGGSSHKRPAPVTIDLTLSDDEDEPRPPPPKRHQHTAPAQNLIYPNRPSGGTSPAGPFTLHWSNNGYGV